MKASPAPFSSETTPAGNKGALDPARVRGLRRALLRWYDAHRRVLPWRSLAPDPYHVLVSEAMLQQTQVATVVPYFERFVVRFPTVQALAAAPADEVLRLWQGLGYYRRARNLQAAAQAIVRDHAGRVPDTVDGLLRLPGVGRYTAGAIASIAFGRRAAILDGNVGRFVARWLALREPIDLAATREALWAAAERLVPAGRPGDFNQAMMELGATVCSPRAPRCLACPVAALCEARRLGLEEALPARLPRRRPREVAHHVVAVRRGDRWLVERRTESGLWAGMWGLPTAESLGRRARPRELAAWLAEAYGVEAAPPTRVARFVHQTTHRTIEFVVWLAMASAAADVAPTRGEWRSEAELAELPLATPQRRALRMVSRAVAGEGVAATLRRIRDFT